MRPRGLQNASMRPPRGLPRDPNEHPRGLATRYMIQGPGFLRPPPDGMGPRVPTSPPRWDGGDDDDSEDEDDDDVDGYRPLAVGVGWSIMPGGAPSSSPSSSPLSFPSSASSISSSSFSSASF